MKIHKLKKERRLDTRLDRNLGIQTFGDCNDYPQQVMQIVGGSGTGSACVKTYAKFISGRGFSDQLFYKKIVNDIGQTNDVILKLISKDYAMFNGFYIHVNYNANFKITEIYHIPYEQVRFSKINREGTFDQYKIHWDWARQMTRLRIWSKEDIETIDMYNPNPAVIDEQVSAAGGWEAYKGQILFFSGEGSTKSYPLPIFDSTLTDMSTEQGLSNISYRNTRSNFLPAGMLINKNNTAESEQQSIEFENSILEYQGDDNSCKIMAITVDSDEEIPQFIPFESKNYDKEFTITDDSIRGRIGRSFMQPPILRSEDIGSNFGSNALKNAYDYYNSITEDERIGIEEVFVRLFSNWNEQFVFDASILPLSYNIEVTKSTDLMSTLTVNEKRALIGYSPLNGAEANTLTIADQLGFRNVQAFNVMMASALPDNSKRALMKTIYGLDQSAIDQIIPPVA